jgi:hypothetical protein
MQLLCHTPAMAIGGEAIGALGMQAAQLGRHRNRMMLANLDFRSTQ